MNGVKSYETTCNSSDVLICLVSCALLSIWPSPSTDGTPSNRTTEWSEPHQVWVADITYIRILTGFLYLAVLLDLFSRKVIGWALSERIDAQLTVAALRMPLGEREAVEGCISSFGSGSPVRLPGLCGGA